MRIAEPYRNEDNNFITLPALKTICNNLNLKTNCNRLGLIEEIEGYANRNPQNKVLVLQQLDKVLREGIKTCVITKIDPVKFTEFEEISSILLRTVGENPEQYLCDYAPSTELGLVKYELKANENNHVQSIEFTFCMELLRRTSNFSSTGVQLFYPVHVTVDIDNGFVIGRAKTTSALFYKINEFEIIPNQSTTTEKIIDIAIGKVIDAIQAKRYSPVLCKMAFQKTIFNILETFTTTPAVIREMVKRRESDYKKFVNDIFIKMELGGKIDLYEEAMSDIAIFIEKLASVSYPNKKIFIMDREAYPIKFTTLDSEFTKIQESTASVEEPLQGKKAFFDSKKVLLEDRKCDKLTLCYSSEPVLYYGKEPFIVSFLMYKSNLEMKFNRFMREDEIQNVLSRIIQMYNVQ